MISNTSFSKNDEPHHADNRWAVVEKITQSPIFKSSPRLCQFLRYISECAIRGVPEEATEQQIGIRVFGRSPGYNSSEDSIVRTHARILRQKLDAYFSQEGSTEEIVVEIPKGHYLPIFRARELSDTRSRESNTPPQTLKMGRLANFRSFVRVNWLWKIGLLATVLVVLGGLFAWHLRKMNTLSESPVNVFWHPFLTGEEPLVIYSNALFTGTSTEGLRYAARPDASETLGDGYVDTYTGIGELASVYNLTRLFDAQHANFILKRSLLVTWDEAETRNLVFIGSPAENTSLRVLPWKRDFTMVATPDSAGVVNHNPLPGEQALYSRPEHPLTTDYAIIALLPGVQQRNHILIFSGLTTYGTQASVDFVCQPETAALLLSKITGPKGQIRPFEAVVETTIRGGVPLQTRLLAVHLH